MSDREPWDKPHWFKYKTILEKYDIHPEMQERVAVKMEKFFRGLSDRVDRGYRGDLGREACDGIDRIVNQYDRRENLNV